MNETLEHVLKSLENGWFANLGQYVNDSEGSSEKQAPEPIEQALRYSVLTRDEMQRSVKYAT